MDENNSLAPASPSSVTVAHQTTFSLSSLNLAENNPYVIVAKTGTTVTPYPFERLKFEPGRQTRFAILTSEVVIVKRHYHQDLGYIISDGYNDKFFDKPPSVCYLYPVVHYTDCSNSGKPLSDAMLVKMLIANKEMYTSICSVNDVKGDITQFDFMGTQLPGNDRFPKTQLMECGMALWRNSDKAVEYITSYMQQNGDRFLSSVGKTYPLEKLEDLLGGGDSSVSTQEPSKDTTEQDLDDIFRPV